MNTTKRFIGLALILTVLTALAACVSKIGDYEPYESAPREAYAEVPFMWRVTSPSGQTMYMFGSIHAATADLYPLSPVIMDAFSRSDYLALEGGGA